MTLDDKMIYAKTHISQLNRACSELSRVNDMLNGRHFTKAEVYKFLEDRIDYFKDEIDKATVHHDVVAKERFDEYKATMKGAKANE